MVSESIQKAIELIEKSAHIALAVPQEALLDELASCEVLAKELTRKGKEVGLLIRPDLKGWGANPLFEITRSSPALARDFVISVDTSKTPVSQLRYEKEGGALNIILSPQSRPITKDAVSFRDGDALCDCALLLGIPNVEDLNGTIDAEPDFFSKVPLINMDVSKENSSYGEVNLVRPEKTSLAEIAYGLLTSLSAEPLDGRSATLLLAALMDKTSNFQKGAGADLFMTASELMRLGADKETAASLTKKSVPVELLQLYGRASVRSRIDPDRGILWSFLTAEDFEKTKRGSSDIPLALDYLEENFPAHNLRVLLWHDSRDDNVRAALSGGKDALTKINKRIDSSFKSPHLELALGFTSFREGEEFITSLLKEII